MTATEVRHLHVVTADEAELMGKRARAWARFSRRYDGAESRRTMRGALDRIARTCSEGNRTGSTFPWEALCDDDLALDVWEWTARKYSCATAQRDASALRVMLECCWKEGLLSYEHYKLATAFKSAKRNWTPPPGRTLSDDEISRLLAYDRPGACPNVHVRDRALVLTLASTGARRTEVSHLRVEDLTLAEGRVRLETTKSGVPRDAWLHPAAAAGLQAWISIRGEQDGPLLVALSRTGRPLLDRRLSEHQIWKVLRQRSDECGIGAVTPHDMRRFVVTRLLEEGHDLLLVSRLVGHSDPSITKLYDKRPAEACRAAVATLPLPMPVAS